MNEHQARAFPFRFTMKRPESGEVFYLLYDNHTSELVFEGTGQSVVEPSEASARYIWETAPQVSPDAPLGKSRRTRTLKIQLGLGCNYSCSYCLQATQLGDQIKTSTRDAEIFLENIKRHGWFGEDVQNIEFWGGEPMLYWHKVRLLLEPLRERWPKAQMSIVTNGSMFNAEILQDILDYEFTVAVSHDGPGQHQRGPDPLDDPEAGEWLRRAVAALSPLGRVSFNSVITSGNYDCNAIIEWFAQRFPSVPSNFEGIGYDYHGDASTRWTQDKLADMQNHIAIGIMDGSLLSSPFFVGSVNSILETLSNRRPSSALGQRCGMDREENIAVDLLGNVTTCQNTASRGKHRLGHMMSLDKVKLDTSWHWAGRDECGSCPVLQQCAGGCMYLEKNSGNWAASCNTEFHFRTGVLAGALYHLTGGVLEHIGGDLIRPELPEIEMPMVAAE
ncbi:radical SAM/SPASM domain-containing protein [Roseibium algae]|uniref:Radical SAM protein n=1 Tax=Roseibium algae TaxID=3123038 RepID=A0ABU8TJX7_9HYPH